ncbi:phosphotransferase family protein [[Mycobacterium] burgundiense]|jgi:aminoglycoside phosphotransferase (APT) family kinase protein|uniref:Phosphotransferase family protein n=1 Tax=[Mycobacterium] burgundiense TaxID=3064286 RepID=A0ABM9LHJ7_9MYCO|nr:phosphotransferase family protein [Mycolicibacterium sp. MU0053]CAJ1499187.1 phosphotransferase family protein [Mycolicibacterium sp. MU0053]
MTEPNAPTIEAAPSMCDQPATVADWLERNGQQVHGPVTIARVGFGQSNITSCVTDQSGREWILREPPPGKAMSTAHDVHREARIISSLAASGIPVPRVVGTGQSPSGTSFFVMDRVSGRALETEQDAEELTLEQRQDVGHQVASILGRLHTLDTDVLGLPESRTPYLERQIRRVTQAWDANGRESRHDAGWQTLRDNLVRSAPPQGRSVVMHGDFRLSNTLIDDGTVTAVLDWELTAIGDPLADLAWLLDDWRAPEDPAIVMPSPTRAGGFPDREEMVRIYSEVSGVPIDRIDYYRAFSQWRAASLLQGVLIRRRKGMMGDHGAVDLGDLDTSIATLLTSAAAHLRQV